MKLPVCLMCFSCILATASYCQVSTPSVIASSGGVSTAPGLVLEWTVGEPFIETISSSSAMYTLGFHQPFLEVQKLEDKNSLLATKNVFRVFPNPTSAVVNIQLSQTPEKPLLVMLVDVNGKVLNNNSLPLRSLSFKMDISQLANGTYFLRIASKDGAVQGEYKIIKAL